MWPRAGSVRLGLGFLIAQRRLLPLLRPLSEGVTLDCADDFPYFCLCALEGRSPPPDLPLLEKHPPGLSALLPPTPSPQNVLGPGKSPVHKCFHHGCHGGQLKIVEMTVNSCSERSRCHEREHESRGGAWPAEGDRWCCFRQMERLWVM